MLQHPTMWFDWKQSKYPSKWIAFIWCFAQEVDWCLKDCDKQRLQTTVSINLWKIFAGHTGDWFDVRTASICTTDLWDALKSFILNSLKFKVAPCPIIVSLDTLKNGIPRCTFFHAFVSLHSTFLLSVECLSYPSFRSVLAFIDYFQTSPGVVLALCKLCKVR